MTHNIEGLNTKVLFKHGSYVWKDVSPSIFLTYTLSSMDFIIIHKQVIILPENIVVADVFSKITSAPDRPLCDHRQHTTASGSSV